MWEELKKSKNIYTFRKRKKMYQVQLFKVETQYNRITAKYSLGQGARTPPGIRLRGTAEKRIKGM